MKKTAVLGISVAASALLLPAARASEPGDGRFLLAQAQPAPQQDPKQKAQQAEAERRAKAEAARQQADRARQQADQARQQAEKQRQQAEQERRARQEQQRREIDQRRQAQDSERKARQDEQRREEDARRAKAEQDRNRAQAERDKAQADRRREDDARRAKAEQERERERADRDKAQAERRREEDARRAKADQERERGQRERIEAERRREEDARRAKADQERLKAQDERRKADDQRAGTRPPVAGDAGRTPPKDGGRLPESTKADGRRDGTPPPGAPSTARAPGSPPTSTFIGKGVAIRDNMKLQDVKGQRQERREGNATIIREPGGRQIVRESNKAVIINNDTSRLRFNARDVQSRSGAGGTRVTTVVRPNGFTVITTEDAQGRVLRRSRRDPSGRERVLFQNRDRPSGWTIAAVAVAVAIPTILIARRLYEVEAREARYDDYYTAFRAEPVSRLDRVYSLDEVRYNYSLRAHMRSVDVNTITFQSGSWDIDPSQFRKLDDIARAIDDVLRDNPDEVFLIEGHTDAIGDPEDNLTLSDRRAESVARVLSEEFGIPPENLTTQGYGEQFPKIETDGSEPRNRRVVIRRITPLVSEDYRR